MSKHILSVCYDLSLMTTRSLILQQAGLSVTSAHGFVSALELCEGNGFDMMLLGHSIPAKDQKALIEEFKRRNPAPVLSLYLPSEWPVDTADFRLDASVSPRDLIETIMEILS